MQDGTPALSPLAVGRSQSSVHWNVALLPPAKHVAPPYKQRQDVLRRFQCSRSSDVQLKEILPRRVKNALLNGPVIYEIPPLTLRAARRGFLLIG